MCVGHYLDHWEVKADRQPKGSGEFTPETQNLRAWELLSPHPDLWKLPWPPAGCASPKARRMICVQQEELAGEWRPPQHPFFPLCVLSSGTQGDERMNPRIRAYIYILSYGYLGQVTSFLLALFPKL